MISIQISYGELADRVSILAVKLDNIVDVEKREELIRQIEVLSPKLTSVLDCTGIHYRSLLGVNKQLWDVEDALRICERHEKFDDEFVQLARSVYKLNDKRYELKRMIDEITACPMHEVKELPKYD